MHEIFTTTLSSSLVGLFYWILRLFLLLWCFISFQDLIIETEHKLALFVAKTAHLKAEGTKK